MRKLIAAMAMVAVSATVVFASWMEDFQKGNIQVAVKGALEEGIAPEEIIKQAVTIEGLNQKNLVKALFCAGISRSDISPAVEKEYLTDLIVDAGYKKSVEECGELVVDTQAYPNEHSRFFNRPPHGNGGGKGPGPNGPFSPSQPQ